MQALILAGGFGTRLQSIVNDVPKPMASVGGRPFLEWQVDYLVSQGIDDIVFLTGHKAEIIESHFCSYKRSIKCTFSKEDTPLGTAGAVFNIWEILDDEFLVINGDSYFDIDLSLLKEHHYNVAAVVTIALRYSKELDRYGIVDVDDDYKIKSFVEKGSSFELDGYINGGIYFFNKESLRLFYENWNGRAMSLEKDVFPRMAETESLWGLPLGGLFIDIGVPDDFHRASLIIPPWHSKERRVALFIDRDNVLIEDKGYTCGTDLKRLDIADEYIRNANKRNELVIVVSNQSGVARGYFTEEDVIASNNAVKRLFYNHGLIINDFYYCPYYEKGNVPPYNIKSLTRKPGAGMVMKACEDYKIDLKRSLMVGDNPETDNIRLPYLHCIITKLEKEC